ncbi:hypothetical protein [Nitrococcus mobilis]|uniref:Uncharacterized protein n=1 Tax=Nitrococcus mobilis Nb-231 TaxID=314278 RepID=A4BUQ0_9GAMM|nr:hypothetical protein [Nitrococcus mobilis]EAR20616.1 hypothetical protein NB231_07452 [Nitrococcus mobilis Nb-231]
MIASFQATRVSVKLTSPLAHEERNNVAVIGASAENLRELTIKMGCTVQDGVCRQ